LAGTALEAYAAGEELKAVLFAQAALGADVGNGARRRLLHVLAAETGISFDPEGVLPPSGLVSTSSPGPGPFFDAASEPPPSSCRACSWPRGAAAWTWARATTPWRRGPRQKYAKAAPWRQRQSWPASWPARLDRRRPATATAMVDIALPL
jgi:hypothetical protein